MAKILIVEDEPDFYIPTRLHLIREYHEVEVVTMGDEALERLRLYIYDLMLLDLDLPDLDGLEVLRQYRLANGPSPVLIVSGKSSTSDRIAGLDAGADDYLVKPFDLQELSARVRALLRRPPVFSGDMLQAGDLLLDPIAHRVIKNGKEIQLLPKEFALLEFFMRHRNQVFSPEAILDRVWKADSDVSPETVRTHIKRLRQKISAEANGCVIQTMHGVGYVFAA